MSQAVRGQTNKELLSVCGITKRFGLNVVLKGIDLSVGRGEVSDADRGEWCRKIHSYEDHYGDLPAGSGGAVHRWGEDFQF